MDNPKTARKWYKKKRWWGLAIAVVAVIAGIVYMRSGSQPTYEMITAKKADLVQEVSVTGKVKPAQAVDLQFESSGRISAINYKVGDRVGAGATIASIENQDLQAEVASARADLDRTVRNFNSVKDPSISSSLRVELENAKTNLDQVKKKADGDLASKYSAAADTLNEAMGQIDSSSVVLQYIRKTYLEARYAWEEQIKTYQAQTDDRAKAVRTAFPQVDNPGSVVAPESYGQVDSALQEMLKAYQSIRSAFSLIQKEMESNSSLISSSADRSNINSEAAALSADLSAISAVIQSIRDQRIVNDKSISDAQSKLATAEASFPTSEDVLQKEAALLSAQSRLRKSLIVAPFTGIIGKIEAERGQTVSSSTIVVSFLSAANYQLEANITEIDIGKINSGNPAVLTLDAYGAQKILNAKVSTVDSAATVVEGVTTYKTILDFEGPVDLNIRPNMTANIDIQTAKIENVISVPQRAIITKNGEKFVRIYHGEKAPLEERPVQTGMSGKDGYVEVVSGIQEGEQVVTFVTN